MRKIYLLINLSLLVTAVGLMIALRHFRPTPPDKILKWTPIEASEAERQPAAPVKVPQLSDIRSKNIFSPTRGDDESGAASENSKKAPPPRFELIGICTIGDGAGAIIDLKNTSNVPQGNKVRRYYASGAEVYDGFLLDSVAETSVILKRRNEVLELKIDRSRYAAEVGKNKSQTPVSNGTLQPAIMPASPRPPQENTPSVPTVRRGPGMPPPGVNP